MDEYKITTEYGTIAFCKEALPGCCGVSVIFEVTFTTTPENKEKLYEYFHDVILFGKENMIINSDDLWYLDTTIDRESDEWCVNKFVLSDYIERKSPSVHEFCNYVGAHYGTKEFNPNSGNHIQVFEINRPKHLYTEHNK